MPLQAIVFSLGLGLCPSVPMSRANVGFFTSHEYWTDYDEITATNW